MDRHQRSSLAIALILILIGVWFLAVQFIPALQSLALNGQTWPLLVVGFGAVWAVVALATWTPGLLIPASIFAGKGEWDQYSNCESVGGPTLTGTTSQKERKKSRLKQQTMRPDSHSASGEAKGND